MDSDLTIQQMVEAYAKNASDHIAVIDEGLMYAYGELNQKANQLAYYLQKFALQQEAIVAISLDRSFQLITSMLAVLKAGCAYLPLDANQPKNRLQYILEDTKTAVLITHSTAKEKFVDYAGHVILIDQIWHEINAESSDNLLVSVRSQQLAYVIYTSGSTGKPKGVLIEHKSVVNYIKWLSLYSACQVQSRIDFSSNVIFDMAVTATIAALALGLQIVICKDEVKKDIYQYFQHLKINKINMIKLTPSYFKVLIQEAQSNAVNLPDLHAIILGGEILHTKDCQHWLEIYPHHILFNEYGPTETTVAVTEYKITSENVFHLGPIVPIGKPGIHMDCQLLDANKQMIPPGEVGELYIGGICLARGYLNQAELTAKQFIPDPFSHASQAKLYKTGDLCRLLPDGNIEFIKRIDDQVKIRGYRIEPGEIEACITSYPQIKEAIVIARENPAGESQLICYYIPRHERQLPSVNELRQYLLQRLADYMIPASFVRLNVFPLTANGKLDKKALPAPAYEEAVDLPQTPLERDLIAIWCREFHLQNIGVQSHFFDLGGHSLIAARMMIEIEKTFGKRIRLEDIYKAPTIKALAVVIASAENGRYEEVIENVSLNNTDTILLNDFQFMFWISNFFEPKIKKINIIARRRVAGRLDPAALTHALEWVFKKHEILIAKVSKWAPVLSLKKDSKCRVIETDLTAYAEAEAESYLSLSLDELVNQATWQKNPPLIIVKLFYLKNETSELQICVPHVVFDDASERILFSDLSTAYLHYKNGQQLPSFINQTQHKSYVLYERTHLNQQLEKDIPYWEQYLHDAALLTLPEEEVIHDMGNVAYSTYLDLPVELINNTQKICREASISITDLLCASAAFAFKEVAADYNDNVFINIIRSIRSNEIYDKTIGCFLRLDPIKVNIKSRLNLADLAKSIQKSRIDTEPHQACSGMIKLACLTKNYRKNFIKNFVVRAVSVIYCFLFPKLKLNSKMLMMYGRLNSLKTKNQFLVDINILNNFISSEQDETLFGLKLEKTRTHQYDLSNIDNVLDICLFRNESLGKAYLVVSGNLKASFRQRIGDEILKHMNSGMRLNVMPLLISAT